MYGLAVRVWCEFDWLAFPLKSEALISVPQRQRCRASVGMPLGMHSNTGFAAFII